MTAGARATIPRDYPKYVLFALLGLTALVILVNRESYLIDAHSPHWRLIERFKWLLLPHALCGLVALVTGPWQFSRRLRATNIGLHRLLGRCYVCAIAAGAPLGLYIGFTYLPYPVNIEQIAQGGLWFLTTAIAYAAIRFNNVTLHRQWMARSYALTFFFVASRLPIFPSPSREPTLAATEYWSLLVLLLISADLLTTWQQFVRKPGRA